MQISNFILGVVTNKTYDNFWPNFSHFFGLVQKIGEFSFFFLGVLGKETKKKFFHFCHPWYGTWMPGAT